MNNRFACLGTMVAVTMGSIGSEPRASHQSSAHTQPATQPQQTRPNHDEQAQLVEAIAELPAWTSSETLPEDDWRRLAQTAAAFQTLEDGSVAAVLTAYMKKYGEGLDTGTPDPDPRTKPLLLLAAMFDFDDPKIDDLAALARDRYAMGVQVCGGFLFRHTHNSSGEARPIPLSWTKEGPTLTAVRATHVSGGSFAREGEYQPWAEFRHFARFYSKRTSFEPYTPIPAPAWRDLIDDRK